jgi:hypothetical protein
MRTEDLLKKGTSKGSHSPIKEPFQGTVFREFKHREKTGTF